MVTAFDITFLDQNEKKQYAYQSTYAISTRQLGVLIATHGDDKGLVLPPKIAPIQVVIIPIFDNKTKSKILKEAKTISQKLKDSHLDDREGYTPGWKFNEWEVRGVPIRLELGPRDIENEQVVLVRRDTREKITVPLKETAKMAKKILDEVHEFLQKRADKLLADSISHPKDYKELVEIQKQLLDILHFHSCLSALWVVVASRALNVLLLEHFYGLDIS